MHIRSENYEESGYGLGLDLLAIRYESRVLNPYTRDEIAGKCNHLRPIYLRMIIYIMHDSQRQSIRDQYSHTDSMSVERVGNTADTYLQATQQTATSHRSISQMPRNLICISDPKIMKKVATASVWIC